MGSGLRSGLLSLAFLASASAACDLFVGSWVVDDKPPPYDSKNCPFVRKEFDCVKYGRPDREYLRYRWRPAGCELPEFDGLEMLRRLRGKKLMFVGDSLSLNMYDSLLCMIYAAAPPRARITSAEDGVIFERHIPNSATKPSATTARQLLKHLERSNSVICSGELCIHISPEDPISNDQNRKKGRLRSGHTVLCGCVRRLSPLSFSMYTQLPFHPSKSYDAMFFQEAGEARLRNKSRGKTEQENWENVKLNIHLCHTDGKTHLSQRKTALEWKALDCNSQVAGVQEEAQGTWRCRNAICASMEVFVQTSPLS